MSPRKYTQPITATELFRSYLQDVMLQDPSLASSIPHRPEGPSSPLPRCTKLKRSSYMRYLDVTLGDLQLHVESRVRVLQLHWPSTVTLAFLKLVGK